MVYELAKKNKKILFVGSDLGAGVLSEFKKKLKKRFFMEGVSEQYITGMCAGLALEGFIPYFNTIATFITRRNFEQNMIDLGLHNLPVRLIGNGGGLVYAPLGPTHQAIEDLAIMRTIPNMNIIAPCDANEMRKLMLQTPKIKGPVYIRLARGGDEIVSEKKEIKFGKSYLFGNPKDILFVTTGITTQECLKVCKMLRKLKIYAGVLHNNTIKPFDEKNLIKFAKKTKKIITVEEHIISGGLGSIVLEVFNRHNYKNYKKLIRLGIDDSFVRKYGSQEDLLKYNNINAEQIFSKIKKEL